MLSEEEVTALAAQLENLHVERKATAQNRSKVEEAICGFSNDIRGSGRTGVILVGVDDKTGAPTGQLRVDDELLRNLASIRRDGNILPFPQMVVYPSQLEGKSIVVIEVEPSPNPPVRLRGRTVVRTGPRCDTATREDERILTERRRSLELSFDQRPVYGSSLTDLDLDMFVDEFLPSAVDPDVLKENGRSVPEQLAALHLAGPDGVPNIAGLLVLGIDPTAFIPGAYVQFLRIGGNQLTDDIIDRKEISGPMPHVLRQMDEITSAHIRVATDVTGGPRELRSPDFPMPAMQQLLRNAVMHRNYETSNAPVQWYWFDDRIEIHNPGGLYGRATPESFGQPGGNDYRNPILAAALHQLGFVQRFGLGIPLARKACADNGNPEPEFVFEASNFAAIVKARS